MEKNREIKFSYILQHEETGMIHEQIFDYLAIFSGACRDHILRMNRHIVVAKRQYTGLLDKNGKEIYEGDIVKDNYCEYSDDSFTVKFYNGAFYPMVQVKEGYNCILKYDKEQFEIIGNIYEPHQ